MFSSFGAGGSLEGENAQMKSKLIREKRNENNTLLSTENVSQNIREQLEIPQQ